MIYALFMLLVLVILTACWLRHALQLPLFLLTVVWMLVYLISDMTTPLNLSF